MHTLARHLVIQPVVGRDIVTTQPECVVNAVVNSLSYVVTFVNNIQLNIQTCPVVCKRTTVGRDRVAT